MRPLKLSMWFTIRDGVIFPQISQIVITLGAITVIEKHGFG